MFVGKIQTGFALDATEGSATTLTSAHFVNNLESVAPIKLETEFTSLKSPGRTGVVKRVKGKSTSTLSEAKLPVAYKEEFPILRAAGFITSGANALVLGNPITSGVNAGRNSFETLTVNQYDGNAKYVLASAKPASLSIGCKVNEPVYTTFSLQGVGTYTTNLGFAFSQLPTTAAPNTSLSHTLSVSGINVKFSEMNIDLGINYMQGDDATQATGQLAIGEIIAYDPKVSLTIYDEVATIGLFSALQAGTVFPVSWTFGSGAGNVYTISFLASVETSELNDEDIHTRTKTLCPITNPSNGTLVTVSVA